MSYWQICKFFSSDFGAFQLGIFLALYLICSLLQLYPHILHFGKIDAATNSLKFCLSRPCSAGEQCFLSYGNFSSSHLITFYGFLPQGNNPYDIIPLGKFLAILTSINKYLCVFTCFTRQNPVCHQDSSVSYLQKLFQVLSVGWCINICSSADIEAAQDDYAEGRCTSNWSTHMVRPTWLSNNHNIFYYGLPSPLLDCLRRARSPMLQTKTLVIIIIIFFLLLDFLSFFLVNWYGFYIIAFGLKFVT